MAPLIGFDSHVKLPLTSVIWINDLGKYSPASIEKLHTSPFFPIIGGRDIIYLIIIIFYINIKTHYRNMNFLTETI